jgi:hypothetical protein
MEIFPKSQPHREAGISLALADGCVKVFCLDPITGESHVFEVTDSLFKWRFDSADTYNTIREGETYEFTTGGYRIPFFSMYPNIYEVKKIDNPIKESKANG